MTRTVKQFIAGSTLAVGLAFGVNAFAFQAAAPPASPPAPAKAGKKTAKSTASPAPATSPSPAPPATPSSPAASPKTGASAAPPAASPKTPASAPAPADVAAAKAKGEVWVNTETKVYHKDGQFYGTTKKGKFMSEADAQKAGYKAAQEPGAKKKATK